MTERPDLKPGVPAPNTMARIAYGHVSERVLVRTIMWPSERRPAEGVVAIVERPQPLMGDPEFAVVVFQPTRPRVADRMHHTRDIRGWYYTQPDAAGAAAKVYRQVFEVSESDSEPGTESDFDPDMLGSVADHLRETWPHLFDSADLPAEELARETLKAARSYLAERR
ncbi:hypothetical protein [Microbispora sp. NPDC049633]|uniref:hypothetical protein n=1 Tax=Microbispora sp. NPDC049633 TaxID=3154355 RepID=UPI00341E5929